MIWRGRLGIPVFVGLVAATNGSAVADDGDRRELTIRKNPFLEGEYDLLDRDGRRVGTLRKNPFLEGEYEIRDRHGERTGTVR
jgi:hypothetical protein